MLLTFATQLILCWRFHWSCWRRRRKSVSDSRFRFKNTAIGVTLLCVVTMMYFLLLTKIKKAIIIMENSQKRTTHKKNQVKEKKIQGIKIDNLAVLFCWLSSLSGQPTFSFCIFFPGNSICKNTRVICVLCTHGG